MRLTFSVLLAFVVSFLVGCEKQESPLQLPPAEVVAGTFTDRVDMGEAYATQFYYDFEGRSVASSSPVNSWDIAFESSLSGTRVFVNGGTNIFVYNTGFRNFANVTGLPAGFQQSQWRIDHPSGNPDSTGIGEWREATSGESKGEVYIIKTGSHPTHKLQIQVANDRKWTIAVGTLSASQPYVIDLPKDTMQSFVYYSLRDGIVAKPDPPKAAWDVVFTRYRTILFDNDRALFTPYIVTGVLLNPADVTVAVDSTTLWENVTAGHASGLSYTSARDGIGWDWKKFDVSNASTARYEVNPNKIYLLRTRHGKLFKLHFLDFYSPQGVKGSPTFEYKQLQ